MTHWNLVTIFALIAGALSQSWDSCNDALNHGISSNGQITVRGTQVYCENANNGGGWQLMAKFSEIESVTQLPSALYDEYFANPNGTIWITGNSMELPLNPNPVYDGFHIESHNWARFLQVGARYQLRQTVEINSTNIIFDVYYDFIYNGATVQNGQTTLNMQSWVLSNRTVLQDNTNIVWDSADVTRFWLPFYPGMTGDVVTACYGFSYDTGACGVTDPASRRYGDSGIIGSATDGNDPAISWLPHTNTLASNYDIAYVHQGTDVFGFSASPMVGKYWIRVSPCSRTCRNNQTCTFINGDPTCVCASPLINDPRNPGSCRSSCATTPQICGQNEECRGDDCVCIAGYQRNLQTGRCQSVPLPPQSIGQCNWWGDPHFTGFGNWKYDYYGGCDYIAARSGNIEVQARFEICNRPGTVSCGSAIAVWIKDVDAVVVVNYRLNVWLNNNPVTIQNTLNIPGGNSISAISNQIKISLADGSSIVVFYGSAIGNTYQINLPIAYYDAVRGLCGNWNIQTGNILPHRDGNDTTNLRSNLLPWAYSGPLVTTFGDSWLVKQSRGDRYLFDPLGAPRCPARKRGVVPRFCDESTMAWAIEQCQVILQNPACTEVDVYNIYSSCIFDTCVTESLDFISAAQDVLAASCAWYQNATAMDVTSGYITTEQPTGSVTSGQAPITSGVITTGVDIDATTGEDNESSDSGSNSLVVFLVTVILALINSL